MATGYKYTSELLPSACPVELPSKFQMGKSVNAISRFFKKFSLKMSKDRELKFIKIQKARYFIIIQGGPLGVVII